MEVVRAMIGIRAVLSFLLIFSATVLTRSQTPPTTQSPPDVHLKLLLADSKAIFRIGDPIRLVMEFTADTPGYNVDILPERQQPTFDTISVSPESGVFRWLDEMQRGVRYRRAVSPLKKLSTTPVRVELTLNDALRFDQPGKYKISVTTRRVASGPGLNTIESLNTPPKPPLELTTNEVSVEVRPMSEEEEEKEIKRVSAVIDAKRDLQTDEFVTRELAFLTGDASTREKVRRFLAPDNRGGNYGANILYGIYIARNRELALELLEKAFRDVNRPVSYSHLAAVSSLRLLLESRGVPFETKAGNAMMWPASDPQQLEIQNRYLSELALSLNKRKGESLTTSAFTVLTMTKKDAENRATLIAEARRVLIQQFDSLSIFGKEQLLQIYWDDLRDPSLVGPLKKLLADNSRLSKGVHRLAVERLLDLSPDEARPYFIAQICDPTSLGDLEVLGHLSDKSLPEVDTCLLEQLRRLKNPIDNYARVWLQNKAALAARFATENIYQDVLEIYRETATSLPFETAAAVLAYLAKQNEAATIPLIEETLTRLESNQDFNFLPTLTKLYYSDGIGKILEKRLELNDPHAVSTAAYLLGKYGSAEDEAVLQKRLDRWRKEWRDRIAEAEAAQQGVAERELKDALVRGTAWQLSPERKRELQRGCLTRYCKESKP
jgi:hypothetical protein